MFVGLPTFDHNDLVETQSLDDCFKNPDDLK